MGKKTIEDLQNLLSSERKICAKKLEQILDLQIEFEDLHAKQQALSIVPYSTGLTQTLKSSEVEAAKTEADIYRGTKKIQLLLAEMNYYKNEIEKGRIEHEAISKEILQLSKQIETKSLRNES